MGASFTLKTRGNEPYVSPSLARDVIEKIVRDASEGAHAPPDRLKILPNVQSFTVYGPPALLRKMAEHSGVAAAIANKQEQDLFIRPVKRRRTRKTAKKAR